jgi:hypothetical protein
VSADHKKPLKTQEIETSSLFLFGQLLLAIGVAISFVLLLDLFLVEQM